MIGNKVSLEKSQEYFRLNYILKLGIMVSKFSNPNSKMVNGKSKILDNIAEVLSPLAHR